MRVPISDYIDVSALVGKTVLSAVSGRDEHGYDTVVILFTDGSRYAAYENGQAGEMLTEYVEPGEMFSDEKARAAWKAKEDAMVAFIFGVAAQKKRIGQTNTKNEPGGYR